MLPINDQTKELAKRVIWWLEPDEALQDRDLVVLQALEHGALQDAVLVESYLGRDGIAAVLKRARPGVLSPASWAYWNAMSGTSPAPEIPCRSFDEGR